MMPASGPVPKAAQRCTRALLPQRPPEIARSAARSTLLTRRAKIHPAASFEPIQGSQKQKNAPNCNFFAIRDCCRAPKRISRRKNAANRLIGSPFVLCTDKRKSAIAKKLHRRRIICFHDRKITITGRILKRDTDKRARIPLAGADNERAPAPAATDIGRRCSGAVNGARLAAQRAAATGGRQRWHRTYTSKSARALQVSIMTRKVRACASKSASGVLMSAGKLKSPWGWPNVPPHGL